MRQRLAKIAVAVEAVSAEAVIMGAVALATNSVAGNSGDGFNSKAFVGMLPRRLCFWITNSPQQLQTTRKRESSMEESISGKWPIVSANACCCAIRKH